MAIKITDTLVRKVAKNLKVDSKKIPLKELKAGLKVELEHGKARPKTNVTGNNILKTGKIALAHLLEDTRYYQALDKMEKKLKKNKNGKKRGSIKKTP